MTRKEIEAKYKKEIEKIAAKNNVDLGVGADMFLHNVAVLTAAADGAGLDWYRGGSFDAIFADYREYKKGLNK